MERMNILLNPSSFKSLKGVKKCFKKRKCHSKQSKYNGTAGKSTTSLYGGTIISNAYDNVINEVIRASNSIVQNKIDIISKNRNDRALKLFKKQRKRSITKVKEINEKSSSPENLNLNIKEFEKSQTIPVSRMGRNQSNSIEKSAERRRKSTNVSKRNSLIAMSYKKTPIVMEASKNNKNITPILNLKMKFERKQYTDKVI